MNLAETLRGLWRRWYILLPGLALACILAVGAWSAVKPDYERAATQLLLPSSGSFAPNTGNPFLNLGGLSQAADVLVDALNGDDVAGAIMDEFPGTQVVVSRDFGNSGPAVLYTVISPEDGEAGEVLRRIVAETETVLDRLQDEESIEDEFRIKTIPITFDERGTVDQKRRVTTAAVVGGGFAALAVVTAALVDGLARRRGARAGRPETGRRRKGGDRRGERASRRP